MEFNDYAKDIEGHAFAFIFNSLDEALQKSIEWFDDPSSYDSKIYGLNEIYYSLKFRS